MAILGQFLRIPQNFEISRIGSDHVRGTMLPLQLFKDSSYRYRPEIWWHYAQYNDRF